MIILQTIKFKFNKIKIFNYIFFQIHIIKIYILIIFKRE